jgi:hypothetical protein
MSQLSSETARLTFLIINWSGCRLQATARSLHDSCSDHHQPSQPCCDKEATPPVTVHVGNLPSFPAIICVVIHCTSLGAPSRVATMLRRKHTHRGHRTGCLAVLVLLMLQALPATLAQPTAAAASAATPAAGPSSQAATQTIRTPASVVSEISSSVFSVLRTTITDITTYPNCSAPVPAVTADPAAVAASKGKLVGGLTNCIVTGGRQAAESPVQLALPGSAASHQ